MKNSMHVRRIRVPSKVLTLSLALILSSLSRVSVEAAPPPGRAITLQVDAREAARKIFHARLAIPVAPGPLTLLYPKWIPGEHGPTGPIVDLAALRIIAAGKSVAWRRDPVDMYSFHCDVPAGADALDVTLDYLSPAAAGGFSSGSSATANLALLSWNQVLVYPKSPKADETAIEASIQLPAGWTASSALPRKASGLDASAITFESVSLTTLVDSPILIGSHVRVVTLDASPIAHRLDLVADSDAALQIRPQEVESYKRLVAETGALFGARHYRRYDFLLTLSDGVAHFGLEHHESSDDRVPERSLIDEDQRRSNLGDLLAHEMVHSWNGKYRRPAGLAPGSFDQPMNGELLWVYEGLTQYLGDVLTARTGFLTLAEQREAIALTAAEMDAQKGRSWRPLQDTADAAQILYGARSDWGAWRRGVDFYPEGFLLWLEADSLIRRETNGAKSLDDFCRLFFGGGNTPPGVVAYTFEDVVAALNKITPHDWSGFWKTRLGSLEARAPLAGLQASGWKLVYRDKPSSMQKARETAKKVTDVRFSLGFEVGQDGAIPDVVPDSPAAKAGLAPGMKLVAVNGRRWTAETLREAVAASNQKPVELLAQNGDFFTTARLDYSGGERYPDLERDPARPDLLEKILQPLVPVPAKKP
jgi:predicted metalloprotease with PDZ domain